MDIARNLQNMENSIFDPNPTRHFNMDISHFDVVDNNDNTPSIVESSDPENVKLSREEKKMNRNELIKLMNFITLKLLIDFLFELLHDINYKTTDQLLASYASA
jgi:hypothetical protein